MEPPVESLFLLPRRRSHLPSRTYRSLVRICSGFSGESRVSLATPTVLQEFLLRSDDNADNEAAQVSLKETCAPGVISPPPGETQTENSSMPESRAPQNESAAPQCCNDVGFGESRIVSDDTANVMTGKRNTTYQGNSSMLGNNFDATDLQDGVDGRSQKIMEDLELMLNEDVDLLQEDCMNLLETLDVADGDTNMIGPLEDNAKEPLDPVPNVVEMPGISTELQGDPIEGNKKISESVDLPPEKDMAEEVSKSADCKEGRSSEISMNYNKTQSRGTELEKSVSSGGVFLTSMTKMVGDEDIEEGEIYGDVYIDYDLPLGDDVPVERMDGKQVTEEIIENGGPNDSCRADRENSSSSPFCAVVSPPEIVSEKGQRESRDKLDAEVGNLDDRVTEDEKVENKARESHETSNKEKLNAVSAKKNKRVRSMKSKANKKAKDRKRRKLLGVKRLKLKPAVPKPKPVKDCRHYLKGRCHKGENCKYSHDIVPLTKSSPCCYFATQTCMKGDDCPFDHDLSKYPCTNFTTKGFCHRGDNCLFSHKGTPVSTSDALKSVTAPSSVSPLSHSKEKPNASGTSPYNVAAASFSFGVSPRQTNKRAAADITTKPPTAFPARVSSPLSHMKPPSQSNQGTLFPSSNEHEKTQTPTRKPSVAPKGVSFLSVDKTSSENSPKTPQHEQASSSSIENLLKAALQKTRTQAIMPSTNNQNSKETLQQSRVPPTPPKGSSFLPFGSNTDNGTTPANAPEEHRTSGTSQFPSTTPIMHTQKTLISALKLAAEFESGKTKKFTNDPAAVNKRDADNTSVAAKPRNSSSKILEFLASFSRSDNR